MRLRGQGQRSCEHEGAILEGFRLSGGRSTGLELHGYLVGIAGKSDSVSDAHGTLGTDSAESTRHAILRPRSPTVHQVEMRLRFGVSR